MWADPCVCIYMQNCWRIYPFPPLFHFFPPTPQCSGSYPKGVRVPQFGNHCITLYSITFPYTVIGIVRPDKALAACNFCQCHMLLVTVYHSVLCFSGKRCAARCLWNSTCSWRAAKSEYYCWCVQTLFVFRCVRGDGSGRAHAQHCEIQGPFLL